MTRAGEFLRRHSLVVGLVLMFFLTWPLMLASSDLLPFQLPFIAALFAGWGVSIAALIMTALTLGTVGVTALLKRFLIWRVSWKWYVVALFLYPFILSAAVWINFALTGRAADFSTVLAYGIFGPAAFLPAFILPFFLTDAISNGEELGWRGYVLPRLQARHTALVSSLIIGLIWAFWHAPLFLAPDNTSPFPIFMVKIAADSVLYTWLYNNTRGSLLLVTLFHATGNTAGVFLPVATTVAGTNASTLAIQVALEILVATVVVLTQGPAQLSRTQQRQVQP
jgi:uncharacterized protein